MPATCPTCAAACDAGTWYYAGYHLATTIATPAAYAYLPFAFASLGWEAGSVMLLLGIATTCESVRLLPPTPEEQALGWGCVGCLACDRASVHKP